MDTDTKIREEIDKIMRVRDVSQVDLAKRLEVTPQAISAVLSGSRGKMPQSLIDILDELGLELTVQAKRTREGISAAGVPYTGDPETDAVLDEHPDILERIARLERGETKLIPIEEIAAEHGIKL